MRWHPLVGVVPGWSCPWSVNGTDRRRGAFPADAGPAPAIRSGRGQGHGADGLLAAAQEEVGDLGVTHGAPEHHDGGSIAVRTRDEAAPTPLVGAHRLPRPPGPPRPRRRRYGPSASSQLATGDGEVVREVVAAQRDQPRLLLRVAGRRGGRVARLCRPVERILAAARSPAPPRRASRARARLHSCSEPDCGVTTWPRPTPTATTAAAATSREATRRRRRARSTTGAARSGSCARSSRTRSSRATTSGGVGPVWRASARRRRTSSSAGRQRVVAAGHGVRLLSGVGGVYVGRFRSASGDRGAVWIGRAAAGPGSRGRGGPAHVPGRARRAARPAGPGRGSSGT